MYNTTMFQHYYNPQDSICIQHACGFLNVSIAINSHEGIYIETPPFLY